MRLHPILCALAIGTFASIVPLHAQLTTDQKLWDFQTLVSLYAKGYAPYEWKRDTQGFDLYNLTPWVQRIRASKTDLEYLQILTEYTGGLNDIHSYYFIDTNFSADLHIFTDVYDGKVLIESIDRSYLPTSRYPFEVGDEVVAVDGKPVMELLAEMSKGLKFANPRSTLRWAADFIPYRVQQLLPQAPLLGDSAVLRVKLANGTERDFTIAWDKSGYPLTKLGPTPGVPLTLAKRGARFSEPVTNDAPVLRDEAPVDDVPVDVPEETELPKATPLPQYKKALARMQNNSVPAPYKNLVGFGSRIPVFALPTGFVRRLGAGRSDFFYTGTYMSNGKRIGYIRIPSFAPVDFSLLSIPVNQFAQEIAFMKANTDGLVVDVMRNPGGYGCYAVDLMSLLAPKAFHTFGNEIRATWEWVRIIDDAVASAEADGATELELAQLGILDRDIKTAYSENRGRTGALPICDLTLDSLPASGRNGEALAYNKPMILLTDEFTTSAGDIFAAMFQDNEIGKIVGYRTAGAGGNTVSYPAGFFAEGQAAVTQMMLTRKAPRQIPGGPMTYYIENVGVHPDVVLDYMTKENLLQRGAPFVQAFTKELVDRLP